MAAFIVPAVAQGIGSIVGGILGNRAAKNAAGQIVDAQGRVIDLTKEAVDQGQQSITGAKQDISTGTVGANDVLGRSAADQVSLYSPYVGAGTESLNSLRQLAGSGGPLDQTFSFNPTDLDKDPGYAFALKQGKDAIERASATKGGLFSGATLKGLVGYSENFGEQYFNDAYQRALSTFTTNRSSALSRIGTLQGIAGMGLQGTSGSASAIGDTSRAEAANIFNEGTAKANLGVTSADLGLRGASMIGQAVTAQGNARAAGTVGGTNAVLGAIQGVTNAGSDAAITKLLLNRGVLGKPSSQSAYGPTYNYPQPAPADYSSMGTFN